MKRKVNPLIQAINEASSKSYVTLRLLEGAFNSKLETLCLVSVTLIVFDVKTGFTSLLSIETACFVPASNSTTILCGLLFFLADLRSRCY